jgi:transcriptional regulator with XRE-family HTH domain
VTATSGTEENWQRVGATVRERRLDLGLTQTEAAKAGGVSLATWRVVEQGQRTAYQGLTLRGVTKALSWRPNAIDVLLDGGDVELLAENSDEEIQVDYNSAIARMPDHVRRAVIELARPYLED